MNICNSSYVDIERATCGHFGITKQQLQGNRRGRGFTRPRAVVSYLARRCTALSFPQIGDRLHKDHTTVLSGARRAEILIAERDPKFREDLAAVIRRLRNAPRSKQQILKSLMTKQTAAGRALPVYAQSWV